METTVAFTFGVLSVLAVILIAVIAVGIVKVIKQGNKIKQLQQYNDDMSREVHLRFDECFNVTNRRFDSLSQEVDRRFEETTRGTDEVRSYVDSRIDKIQNKTQLIKG